MKKTVAYVLLGGAAPHRVLCSLTMAQEGEEDTGAGSTNELPEGVTDLGGGTLQAVADREGLEKAAQDGAAEGLPEGFSTWQDYAKSLEGKKAGEESAEEAPPAEEKTEEQKAAEEAARKVAVEEALTEWPEEQRAKAQPYVEAFAATGTLTDEQVAQAAKDFNLPESAVRQYMDGAGVQDQAALADLAAREKPFTDLFEGKENYTAFQKWANENLSDEDKEAYDEALDSSPKSALRLAKEFKAKYEASGGGKAPRDITSAAGAGEGDNEGGYATEAEWKADMANPKYQTDASFREKVYERLSKSPF